MLRLGLGLAFFLCCINAQWPTNIVPRLVFYARPAVIPNEPSVMMHTLRYVTFAWFETWAACNDTAVGPLFLGSLRRTNQAVNCTLINKNTAYAYAAYRVLSQPLLGEFYQGNFNAMMAEFGLNPADTSNDTSTPIGLGNTIGYAIVDFMQHDGMNSLGDLTQNNVSGTAFGIPYSDYTNYYPRQTAYELTDPDHFQPLLENKIGAGGPFLGTTKIFGNSGANNVQNYITPHMRYVKAFSFKKPNAFMANFSKVYAKYNGGNARRNAYLQQAAEVLAMSASLTDQDKVEAEFFENKNLVFGTPMPFLASTTRGTISGQTPWTVDDWVCWEFLINAAVWDSVILSWSVKRKRDAVRPITAIRFLYQNQMVNAWGGPGKGTVSLLGAGWRPFLRTMAHSEYPSASSCMCAAFAEANRQWFGHDNFGFSFPVTQGSSSIEPGFVPAANMTLGPFATFTEYANTCGQARFKAGVHFQQSIEESLANCPILGKVSGDLFREYLAGTVTKKVKPDDHAFFHPTTVNSNNAGTEEVLGLEDDE